MDNITIQYVKNKVILLDTNSVVQILTSNLDYEKNVKMKVGDTDPPFIMYFTETINGVTKPVDLTGCTIAFVMSETVGGVPIVNAAADITYAAGGVAQYSWVDLDTANPGKFLIVAKVTNTLSGKVRTFPDNGYISFSIESNL